MPNQIKADKFYFIRHFFKATTKYNRIFADTHSKKSNTAEKPTEWMN